MQRRGALSVRRAAGAALSVAVGGAIVMVAGTSTSAPSAPVTAGCSFFDQPRIGPQRVEREGGSPFLGLYGTVNIESNGQNWEARSHVENDFNVDVTSVRSACIDAGVKCWEIHGRLRTTVPSEILAPFAAPLTLSATF